MSGRLAIASATKAFARALELAGCGQTRGALQLIEPLEPGIRARGPRDTATLLLLLGALRSDAADYAAATAALTEAARLYRELGDRSGAAKAHKNLGSNHEDQGAYAAALSEYRTALGLFEALGDQQGVIRTWNELGVVHKNLNLWGECLRVYATALELLRGHQAPAERRNLLANCDTAFSQVVANASAEVALRARRLFDGGDLSGAIRLLEEGADPWLLARHNLARARLQRELPRPGGRDAAEHLVRLAEAHLARGEIEHGVQELWSAASTTWIADSDKGRAVQLLGRVCELCEEHGRGHDLLHAAQHLGECLADAGRLEEAAEALSEVAEEAAARGGRVVAWRSRAALADVLERLDRPEEASQEWLRAIAQVERIAAELTHPNQLRGFFADKTRLFQRCADLAVEAGQHAVAIDAMLAAKARPFVVFRDRAAGADAPPEPPAPAAGRRKAAAQSTGVQSDWRQEAAALRRWSRVAEARWTLPGAEPADRTGSLETLRQRLPADTVVLDFFFTESRLCLLAIYRDRCDLRSVGVRQTQLFDRLRATGFLGVDSLSRGLSELTRARGELQAQLGPAVAQLLRQGRIRRACLVPHGLLHLTPVQSTVSAVAADIGLAGLVTWLVPHAAFCDPEAEIRWAAQDRYLGIAASDGELAETGEEIRQTGALFRHARCEPGMDRARTLRALQTADVVHFACHGQFRVDFPELSYLALAAGERLTAAEILHCGWTRAKLVVLSACWSSVGQVGAADEVGSLARSFLFLGVRAVVATLWPVPDRGARRFVGNLFRAWVQDAMPLREAFAHAQTQCADDPTLGAAFALVEAGRRA